MARLVRMFFEMNDMEAVIIALIYFIGVLIGIIYCIKHDK